MAWLAVIAVIASALLTSALAPKPKQRKQKNEVHRQGEDHDLEIVYGTRRVGLVPVDHLTSRRMVNPQSLAGIANVIRSAFTYKGRDHGQSDSKNVSLVISGPMCIEGRLGAPFQGAEIEDLNAQVDEKDYDDPTLVSIDPITVGSYHEVHLVGGVRHPLAAYFGLGDANARFAKCISATVGYVLNIEKEIVYTGIPEQTYDLTCHLLYEPTVVGNVWDDPTTWTGRADDPILQFMDYLFRADFGPAQTIDDFNLATWFFTSTIGNVPTGTVVTTRRSQAFSFDETGAYSATVEEKRFQPGYLFESNLTLSTENPINENLEELLAACRGAAFYKDRQGRWSIQPDWIHEDDLTQVITGVVGVGPFPMDWPTDNAVVRRNGVIQGVADFDIVTTAVLTTTYANGSQTSQTGTDPDSVIGISFTPALLATDIIEIDYKLSGLNPGGILGMQTQFHIVDKPETLGLDYDADQDVNGIDLIRIEDATVTEHNPVSLDERRNQVVVKFPDRETKYKQNQVVWPADGSPQLATFRFEDNGKELIETVSVNHIDSTEKALDFAEFLCRQSRSADLIVYHLQTEALQADPLDFTLVTDPRININGQLYKFKKIDPQEDTTCLVTLKRYDLEDFTYAVESFQEERVDLITRVLGPVTNLSISLTETDGLLGSGLLRWDGVAGADGYVSSVSIAAVWNDTDSFSSGTQVYYNGFHYQASVEILPGGAAPDVNVAWVDIEDDNELWRVFSDSPTLSAVVPVVTVEAVKAYRVQPKNQRRGLGLPAFLTQLMAVDSADRDVIRSETQPTGTSYTVGTLWLELNASGAVIGAFEWNGSGWVKHIPPNPGPVRLVDADPNATVFEGHIVAFNWEFESDLDIYRFRNEFWWNDTLHFANRTLTPGGRSSWLSAPAALTFDSIGTPPRLPDGAREITCRIYTLSPDGKTRSAQPSEITVRNEQYPALADVSAKVDQRTGKVIIPFPRPLDSEFSAVLVYGSLSSGFTPGPENLVETFYDATGRVEPESELTANARWYFRIALADAWGQDELSFSNEFFVDTPSNFGGLAFASSITSSGQLGNNVVTRQKVAAGDLVKTHVVLNIAGSSRANASDGNSVAPIDYTFSAEANGLILFQLTGDVDINGFRTTDHDIVPYCLVQLQVDVNGLPYYGRSGMTIPVTFENYDFSPPSNTESFYSAGFTIVGSSQYDGFPSVSPGSTIRVNPLFIFKSSDGSTMADLFSVNDCQLVVTELNNI